VSAFTCFNVMPGLVPGIHAFGTTTHPHPEEARNAVSKDEASPAITGRSFETLLAAAPQDEGGVELFRKERVR
jgi:hypothetical protein